MRASHRSTVRDASNWVLARVARLSFDRSTGGMARRLRIQYCGARYHVINRGNLQHNVFITSGAIRSFIVALGQAATQFGWRVHAYVVMRNHYHLALETPQPNLVDGMHWLQSTFATRLTRFHGQHGHVFQGRYKSLLIEDGFHLARVCDYIHLNPVRARVVPPERICQFESSSLACWLSGAAPNWLHANGLLSEAGLAGCEKQWAGYVAHLIRVATAGNDDECMSRGALSRGWAIGTAGWRKAIAREHQHLALAPEMSASEIADMKSVRWCDALTAALAEFGKTPADLANTAKGAQWKVAVARTLRETVVPSYDWLAEHLCMGKAASVRVYLSRGIND